jgi:hypothetical protein
MPLPPGQIPDGSAARLSQPDPPASEGEGSVTEPRDQATRGGAFALALICAAQFVLRLDF